VHAMKESKIWNGNGNGGGAISIGELGRTGGGMGTSQSSPFQAQISAGIHVLAEAGELRSLSSIVRGADAGERRKLVNARDAAGKTVLMTAASSVRADVGELRREKLCKLLLDFGAQPDAVETRSDRAWRPLHFACSIGAVETADLLLRRGADPLARDAHGLQPLQVLASLVQGREPVRSLAVLSSDEDLGDSDNDDFDDEEETLTGTTQSHQQKGETRPLQRMVSTSRSSIASVGKSNENLLRLPRALLQEARPLFREWIDFRKWQSMIQIGVRKCASDSATGQTRIDCVVYLPSEATLARGLDRLDFVQVMAIREKPWNFAPVLGCFKRISNGRILVGKDTPPQVTLTFPADMFGSGYHSYRFVYVLGEMSEEPEKILAASDVFHMEGKYGFQIEVQGFFEPPSPEQLNEQEEQDATKSSSESLDDKEELDLSPLESENEDELSSDESSLEEDSFPDFEEELKLIQEEHTCVYGAPWNVNANANKRANDVFQRLVKQRVLQLSMERNIWASRWTKLIYEPPEDFDFEVGIVYSHAKVALEKDPNLSRARLQFVPGKIPEKEFWRAYFWHVELIKLDVTNLLTSGISDQELDKMVKDLPDLDEHPEDVFFIPISFTAHAQVAVLRSHINRKLESISSPELSKSQQDKERETSPAKVQFTLQL